MIRYHLNDTVLIHMRAIRIDHQFQFHPHSVHIKSSLGWVKSKNWNEAVSPPRTLWWRIHPDHIKIERNTK